MITPLWNAVRAHLSAERMQADIAEFFEFSRWSSFNKINGLAQCIAGKMEALGLEDVRLIEFPADGRTAYGGWVMPRAYDVHDARLTLLGANGPDTVLADYRENPVSLMLYSLPTPPGGITAELVVADTIEQMTPERLSGRLALTSGIGVEYSQAAMRAGAVGLISDCRNAHRWFKNGPEVDRTNEWHNYTIPPWDDPNKGFGFSLSPEQGKSLRAMLAAGQAVRLHAAVATTHYDGVLPVVSGRLPGSGPEEIVLTGHYDEFGADDNCSQVAVALEVVRAIRAMVQSGELPPLQRGIRVLLPMEVRGFNALIQDPAETRAMCAGLNIDTVGTDQNRVTSACTLSENFLALPSYTDELVAELLARTAEENPLFRWRRTDAEMIDNIFGEPLIGAPTPAVWHFSATHHLATDTPDRISPRMLEDMARMAAVYAAFLANAGLEEALWLSELTLHQGVRRLWDIASKSLRDWQNSDQPAEADQQIAGVYERYWWKLASPARLVPSLSLLPCPEVMEARGDALVGEDRLLPGERFNAQVSVLQSDLDRTRGETAAWINRGIAAGWRTSSPGADAGTGNAASSSVASAGTATEAMNAAILGPGKVMSAPKSRCVPVKTFRGFTAFENLNETEGDFVRSALGIASGWGAPMWLQNALMLANGKRTAGEIADLLRCHLKSEVEVARLELVFEFLAQRGMVRLRPYLTQDEIREALIQAGLERGDIVLAHFALSWFGYIEGGADALIDTLLSILGPGGTLVMPTFTFSWLGRLPYDPLTSASRVGAVTDRFWRRPGVLRSAHPTHAFAAAGKHAAEILMEHDHTHSPLSKDGPLGRLEALDGKILMFAPAVANTTMHVGEYRAGLPLLDFICPIVEGEDRVRREILVPDCPWHVRFDAAYEKLYARGLVREVTLGENTLRAMRARDAINAQAEVMRETPEDLLAPGCNCLYCQRLKEYCRAKSERV